MSPNEKIKLVLNQTPQLFAILSIAISGIAFLCFILFCFIYIPHREISTSSQDLGLYGDFIGGVVGTVISLASLGVTIYLAITLRRIEKDNVSSTINAQRSIALMQMKHQELAIFKTNCDTGFSLLKSSDIGDSEKGYNLILLAVDRLTTLFPSLAEDYNCDFTLIALDAHQAHQCNAQISRLTQEIHPAVELDLINQMFSKIMSSMRAYLESLKNLSNWVFENKEDQLTTRR